MSKLMTQFELVSHDDKHNSNTTMMTWLENDAKLKKGVKITLKDDDRLWTINNVYNDVQLQYSELQLNRKWDNNNYDKHQSDLIKGITKK